MCEIQSNERNEKIECLFFGETVRIFSGAVAPKALVGGSRSPNIYSWAIQINISLIWKFIKSKKRKNSKLDSNRLL